MKLWPVFVVLTILCWGAYVPTIHQGQTLLGKNSALRAFLFVGLAYFLMSVVVFGYLAISRVEPLEVNSKGMTMSILAGILGAIGALGIVFAIKHQGRPIVVAPLVFAGAPIVNTLVSIIWHRPANPPQLMFYVGILLAAVGASIVLSFKPT